MFTQAGLVASWQHTSSILHIRGYAPFLQVLPETEHAPFFMAPEIFEGKSYGYQVDGWAAGCFSVFIAWYTILGLTQDREEIVCKNVSLKR